MIRITATFKGTSPVLTGFAVGQSYILFPEFDHSGGFEDYFFIHNTRGARVEYETPEEFLEEWEEINVYQSPNPFSDEQEKIKASNYFINVFLGL
jgi:hypothetical protein